MRYNSISNFPQDRSRVTHSWVYWDDIFTDEELQKIIDYCEAQGTAKGVTFGSDDPWNRISQVKFHNPNEDTAWIFEKLNSIIIQANNAYYGFDINGYDAFQYTTYAAEDGGFYGWHMDMALGNDRLPLDMIETRKLSMSLILNDDFEGGEFQINLGDQNQPLTTETKKGRAILFPSFMCHRVAPVSKGIRRSLVVWATGPKFT